MRRATLISSEIRLPPKARARDRLTAQTPDVAGHAVGAANDDLVQSDSEGGATQVRDGLRLPADEHLREDRGDLETEGDGAIHAVERAAQQSSEGRRYSGFARAGIAVRAQCHTLVRPKSNRPGPRSPQADSQGPSLEVDSITGDQSVLSKPVSCLASAAQSIHQATGGSEIDSARMRHCGDGRSHLAGRPIVTMASSDL